MTTNKPCCITGCPNKNTGKKDRCSTHYKAWKRENIPGFIEKEKAQTRRIYAANPEKRRAISRKSKEKSELQPLESTKWAGAKDLRTICLLVSEITRLSEVPGNAWRTLLNNMIEDEMIHSWSYEPETATVTLQYYVDQELAFVVGLNQQPAGVLTKGTIAPDTMGSKGNKNEQ